MRSNREDAQRNRMRVVRAASQLFRQHGYDGVGIATLMKETGLTNGAFYKQFDSKDELIAEATLHALSENSASWEAVLEKADGDPLTAITRWYLAEAHLGHRSEGCTYAALAAEAPRHEQPVREAFTVGVRRTLDIIAEAMESGDRAGAQPATIRYLCQLVGALILARAVSDTVLAKAILAAGRSSS
ncbi:TetR/AcrR family transcriptional regulator [Dongia sedimenti]|uniref:TetR/AcrR family transcriptional regulator n=1 Tax=Dongia sedimenti TaxID=3064282 RepID=A0ABU0YRR8_9PROT|nr:TetR/AcrR family transcriptional regulator [Rhodospirillaceae bacterium R-7]